MMTLMDFRWRLASALAACWLGSLILAEPAPAQTPPAAPAVGALADGWQDIDQRVIFLTSELASNEASLDAVNKAMVAAGYQKAATTQKADEFIQNNVAMDRNGGGPIPWQQFYGKTAADFYYRPTSTVDTTGGGHTGTEVTHADAAGPQQAIERPPQLDYLYKANAESAQKAEADAAKLGKQLDKLLARRRELESEESALWCKISFRAVTSLDLADKPLYLFDPSASDDNKAEEEEAAMTSARDFVRLVNLAVDRAQKDVDANQSQTYGQLQKVVSGAQGDLQKVLLKQRQLTAEMSDPKSLLAQFDKATKRLGDSSQNMVDAAKLAAQSDADDDDDRKNNLRGVLQQNLMDFASTMITADQTLTALAAQWKVTPDRSHEAKDIVLPVMQTAPAAAAPRRAQSRTIIIIPAAPAAPAGPRPPFVVDMADPPADASVGDTVLVAYTKGGSATLSKMDDGQPFYSNRGAVIGSLPAELKDLPYAQRPHKVANSSAASSDCVIDAPAGATVYITAPISSMVNISPPLLKAGWTRIDDFQAGGVAVALFKYDFTKAQRVMISEATPSMAVAAKKLAVVEAVVQSPAGN